MDPRDRVKRMPPRGFDDSDRVWARIVEGDEWTFHRIGNEPALSKSIDPVVLAEPPELLGHVLHLSGKSPGTFHAANGKELLDDLVALVEVGDQVPFRHDPGRFVQEMGGAVERLYMKYGPLNWCSCSKGPLGHPASVRDKCRPVRPEPMVYWWRVAHQARSILLLASEIHDGSDGSLEEWGTALLSPHQSYRFYTAEEVKAWVDGWSWRPRELLAGQVRRWLGLCVAYGIVWKEEGPARVPVYHALNPVYGAIAFHLAIAVCAIPGVARCSECGTIYPRSTLPNPRRRNYCSDSCRKRADAKRQRRNRREKSRR